MGSKPRVAPNQPLQPTVASALRPLPIPSSLRSSAAAERRRTRLLHLPRRPSSLRLAVHRAGERRIRPRDKEAGTPRDLLPTYLFFLSMTSELDSNLTVIPIVVLSSYGSG